MQFENKLVAIVNKDMDPGVAMNALAHMSIGIGAKIGPEKLHLSDYKNKDGGIYPSISNMPYIILRGKSNEIKKAINAAREAGIDYSVFTDTMTGGTYVEQLERTEASTEEGLVFYGGILFGPWDKVAEITRKFSIYK